MSKAGVSQGSKDRTGIRQGSPVSKCVKEDSSLARWDLIKREKQEEDTCRSKMITIPFSCPSVNHCASTFSVFSRKSCHELCSSHFFLSLYEYGLAGVECLSDLLPSAGVTAPLSAHSSSPVLLQQGSHSPHCEDVSLAPSWLTPDWN